MNNILNCVTHMVHPPLLITSTLAHEHIYMYSYGDKELCQSCYFITVSFYFFLKIFHIIVTALLCYYSSGHFCWLFVQGVIHGQGIIISYRYLVTNTFKDIRHISPAPAMLTENLLKI